MPGETHVPDEYICWGLREAELCYLWLSKVDFTVLACQSAMCLTNQRDPNKLYLGHRAFQRDLSSILYKEIRL